VNIAAAKAGMKPNKYNLLLGNLIDTIPNECNKIKIENRKHKKNEKKMNKVSLEYQCFDEKSI